MFLFLLSPIMTPPLRPPLHGSLLTLPVLPPLRLPFCNGRLLLPPLRLPLCPSWMLPPGPFPDLLCVPTDIPSTAWASPSASPSSRLPARTRSSSRARGTIQPYPFFMSSPRRQPTAHSIGSPQNFSFSAY